MTLIDKFENAPFQNVETFNEIFPWTPILGYSLEEEVAIGGLTKDSERLISVKQETIKMSLIQPKTERKERRSEAEKSRQRRKREKLLPKRVLPFEFSSGFKELTFGEFFVYSALMELGEVSGLELFSKSLGIDAKTMSLHIRNLTKKGYVEKTAVYKGIKK